MSELMEHQLVGAAFLADREGALLADEQRVGKTATAITACDYVFARKILIITKSSARADWGAQVKTWGFPRSVQVVYSANSVLHPDAEVVVVGWGMVYEPKLLKQLKTRDWDVIIPDEAHEAKNPEAKRAQAVWVELAPKARFVWPLTGTPVPNAPNDLHPMLNAIAKSRLLANEAKGWPDVTSYEAFVRRYCVTRRKNIGHRWIEIIVKGQNEAELAERLNGFYLRRTQLDVGIKRPLFSVFALDAPDAKKYLADRFGENNDIATKIIEAAENGTQADEHMAKLRRVTGLLKARLVAERIAEELDSGLDKIVLMAWHTEVIDFLKDALSRFGTVVIDGRTQPTKRQAMKEAFNPGPARVFIGQILAAGEALDLSSAASLMFVEPSFTPKDMSQAAMRITHHNQKRQPIVRFAALGGSIDEAFIAILTRKVASIKQVMEN